MFYNVFYVTDAVAYGNPNSVLGTIVGFNEAGEHTDGTDPKPAGCSVLSLDANDAENYITYAMKCDGIPCLNKVPVFIDKDSHRINKRVNVKTKDLVPA